MKRNFPVLAFSMSNNKAFPESIQVREWARATYHLSHQKSEPKTSLHEKSKAVAHADSIHYPCFLLCVKAECQDCLWHKRLVNYISEQTMVPHSWLSSHSTNIFRYPINTSQEEEFHLWIIENSVLCHIWKSDSSLSLHENMQHPHFMFISSLGFIPLLKYDL